VFVRVAFFSYADMEAEAYTGGKNANDVSQHLLIDVCADLEYFVEIQELCGLRNLPKLKDVGMLCEFSW